MMDLLSIILLFLFLPVPFVLFVAHPLINFWRRIGKPSYMLMVLIWLVLGIFILLYRHEFLAYRIMFRPLVHAFGWVLVLGGIILAWAVQRQLTLPVLVGFPELMPKKRQSKLVTIGLYARMRHPRYVGYFSILEGWYLVSGYVIFPIIPLFLLIAILFEERELKQRFGKAYRTYMQHVPAFFPRLRAWSPRKR